MAVVKNFGLKGVADDVQFGKAGGRIRFNPTGGSGGAPAFSIDNAAGANISLQGGAGVLDNEYVTVAQLNSVAAGITVKQSARVATQTDIVAGSGIYNAGGGAGGSGQITGAPSAVDGVTLVAGDRILVRLEGVVFDVNGNLDSISEPDAVRNGIYVATADTTIWDRASDHDEDGEVTYGNYIFVTEGSTNEGQAFVLSNILNKPITADAPTLNAEPIAFVLFSAAPTYEAAENGGLEVVNGDEFRLDIDNLTTGATTLNSTVAFGDGGAGGPDSKDTLGSILNTHNVVYGIGDFTGTGAGFVVRTSEDTYKIANLVADTDAGSQGITVQEDLAGTGNVQIGLDIAGLSDVAADESGQIAYFDGVNNSKRSFQTLAQDIDIVRSNTFGSGIITKTGNDTYAGRQITVDTGSNAGLVVTNGDLVATDAVIGLDIALLDAKTVPVIADEFIVRDSFDGSNKRTTINDLLNIIADNISDDEISADDSRVSVIDTGPGGYIEIAADNAVVATFDSAKANITALEVADLGDTQVVVAGPNGRLTSGAGFTYNGTTLTISGDVSVSGDVGAVDGNFSGNVSAIGGNFSGNVGAVDGNFTGNLDVTNAITGGSLDVGLGTISGGDITGNSLNVGLGSITGGPISGTTGNFSSDLTVTGSITGGSFVGGDADFGAITGNSLAVTGDASAASFTGGTVSGTSVTGTQIFGTGLGNGEIVFAGAGGELLSDADLTFDGLNLTVGGTITAGGINLGPGGSIEAEDVTVGSLTEGRVVFAGVDGLLIDDGAFTYGAGALSVGTSVTSALFTGGAFDGSTGTFSGAITGASLDTGAGTISGGAISGTTGALTGDLTVGGNLATTGTSSALSYAAGIDGISDASLTGNGAVVYSNGTKRLVDNGTSFSYDEGTDTLTVGNLNLNGSFNLPVGANELAFGDSTTPGNVTSSSTFAVDDAASKLSIGALDIIGDSANQSIVGNVVDGDISIVPNGAGEVIIGSAGAGVIASEDGQSMTISGATSLFLESGSGSVIIKDGGLEVAQFDSNAGADTWLTFQSDLASNGVKIGTSQPSDVKFVLGAGQLVKPENAADYNATLAASGAGSEDAFVTKAFVETAIEAGQPVEMYKSIVSTIDLSANGTTNINVANGSTLPADATVLRIKVQIVTADTGATLTVGAFGGNLSRYMGELENDPQEANGIFVSEVFDTDASAVQLVADVQNTAGSVGANAVISIEYRVPVTA